MVVGDRSVVDTALHSRGHPHRLRYINNHQEPVEMNEKDAAHKSVLHLSDVSFDMTENIFLELCKEVRTELDTTIQRLEDHQSK